MAVERLVNIFHLGTYSCNGFLCHSSKCCSCNLRGFFCCFFGAANLLNNAVIIEGK